MEATYQVQTVTVSVETPDGWFKYPKVVEPLVYPAELVAVSTFELPLTTKLGDRIAARPRIEQMPASGGTVIWATLGDRRSDVTDDPAIRPFAGAKVEGLTFATIPPLDLGRDERTSMLAGVEEYLQIVGLDDSLYIYLWVWNRRGDLATINKVLQSITLSF